jgi:predicted nucleotidyltransferase
MRKSSPIDALLPKTRQGVLAATMMQPERWWYLSDLAKHLGIQPSSLQRELSSLVSAGVLRRRKDGNRVYYQADPDCPFLRELQGLLAKTSGLADVLRQALSRFADSIEVAFVYGSIAKSEERSESDVDLMIVGDLGLKDLSAALSRAEGRLNREVNAYTFSMDEFVEKAKSKSHFIRSVLEDEKIFVIGNERDLEGIAR